MESTAAKSEDSLHGLSVAGLVNPDWVAEFPLPGDYTVLVPTAKPLVASGPESALKPGRPTR